MRWAIDFSSSQRCDAITMIYEQKISSKLQITNITVYSNQNGQHMGNHFRGFSFFINLIHFKELYGMYFFAEEIFIEGIDKKGEHFSIEINKNTYSGIGGLGIG